jgi:membrane protease YdiL (CAAX protease family)
VPRVEPLRTLLQERLEQQTRLFESGAAGWALLAVVVTPIVEETLFRGLVFKGLRRTRTPAFAILASAAIFAIVQAPAMVVPAFGLGVAAALAFEISGSLLAPILAHALYNGAVLLLSS